MNFKRLKSLSSFFDVNDENVQSFKDFLFGSNNLHEIPCIVPRFVFILYLLLVKKIMLDCFTQ